MALTILAGLVIVAAVVGLFFLLAIFARLFAHVFLPLAVAAVAALVFQPYYDWLRARAGLPPPLAVAAVLLSIVVPLGLFGGFFGSVLIRELIDLIAQLPAWWQQVLRISEQYGPEVHVFLTQHPVGRKLAEIIQEQGPRLMAGLEQLASTSVAAGTNLVGWAGRLLGWVVTPVYFVFILLMPRKDVARLEHYLPFLKQPTRNDVVFLVREFVNIVVGFFRGQLVIAFLQGVLLAIGFSLVGLKYGLLLGFVLGFFNVIPYLGSILGWTIALPLAFFQRGGGLPLLGAVVVVLLLVQLIESYVLTPRIMGQRTGLHPMAIIFAVFFWGAALGGILGMILAIPLTAFLVVFWRLAREKYIGELV